MDAQTLLWDMSRGAFLIDAWQVFFSFGVHFEDNQLFVPRLSWVSVVMGVLLLCILK